MQVMSHVAARLEEIVLGWMTELLGLPSGCGGGFATGTTMANFAALAAARTTLLKRAGLAAIIRIAKAAKAGGMKVGANTAIICLFRRNCPFDAAFRRAYTPRPEKLPCQNNCSKLPWLLC